MAQKLWKFIQTFIQRRKIKFSSNIHYQLSLKNRKNHNCDPTSSLHTIQKNSNFNPSKTQRQPTMIDFTRFIQMTFIPCFKFMSGSCTTAFNDTRNNQLKKLLFSAFTILYFISFISCAVLLISFSHCNFFFSPFSFSSDADKQKNRPSTPTSQQNVVHEK